MTLEFSGVTVEISLNDPASVFEVSEAFETVKSLVVDNEALHGFRVQAFDWDCGVLNVHLSNA